MEPEYAMYNSHAACVHELPTSPLINVAVVNYVRAAPFAEDLSRCRRIITFCIIIILVTSLKYPTSQAARAFLW